MLDASHALIGASIAKLVPHPYLGLPLALASHFLADLIPHWDLRTRKVKRSKTKIILYSLTDASIGYFIAYLLFAPSVSLWYLAAIMFTAQLPDWLEAPYHVFDWRFPPFSTIKKLQSKLHRKLDLPWGLATQILILFLAIFLSRLS
jgi:hypothetical protein